MADSLITCAVCSARFTASRSHAVTCSTACRAKRTRATAKARREGERRDMDRAAAALSALATVAALTPDD